MAKSTIDNQLQQWEYPEFIHTSAVAPNDAPLDISKNIPPEDELSIEQASISAKEQMLIDNLSVIDAASQHIHTFYQTISQEMIIEGSALINKITHRVIQKEFDIDAQLIQKKVDEALHSLASKDMASTLMVSSEDFEQLKTYTAALKHLVVKVDASLIKGQFTFKTANNEVEFDLEKRINELFKL